MSASRPSTASVRRRFQPSRGLAGLVLLAGGCLQAPDDAAAPGEPPVARAQRPIAGNANRMKIAMDAPWRMEPEPSGGYGPIPVSVTLIDNDAASEESVFGAEYDKITKIVVEERQPFTNNVHKTEFSMAQLHEIEAYSGRWDRNSSRNFDSAPCTPGTIASLSPAQAAFSAWASTCPSEFPNGGLLCRNWRGNQSGCQGVATDALGGKGAWHATLLYTPFYPATSGRRVALRIRAHLREDDLIFDDDETIAHDVSVLLAPAPLPKFSSDWAYGDLHYHTQLTNNFGESGTSFRESLYAMNALGLDFAFATDHTSDNDRIFDFEVQTGGYVLWGLGDASPTKWAFGHWLLNQSGTGSDGANRDVASVPRLRQFGHAAAQLFMASEADVIVEANSASEVGFGRIKYRPADNNLSTTLASDGRYLVKDGQGILGIEHFSRQHLLVLPRDPARRDSGVFGDTNIFGGPSRRFKDVLQYDLGRRQKGYAFLAHPFERTSSSSDGSLLVGSGPAMTPYSVKQMEDAFASPYVLGLEFWNENTRWKSSVDVDSDENLSPFFNDVLPDRADEAAWLKKMSSYLANWDEVLLWGLDPARTATLGWLPAGDPRRLFMAGGSDAHGDLNYRREGRNGIDGINDTAIGNPRNLVMTGPPQIVLPNDIRTTRGYSQTQVVDGLRSGNFSVTDGPAARIVRDVDGDGVPRATDPPMGSVSTAWPMAAALPIVVEWQTTSEFGEVDEIALVVGVHGQGVSTKYRGNLPPDEAEARPTGQYWDLPGGRYFLTATGTAGGPYWMPPDRSALFADARTDSRVRCTALSRSSNAPRTCRIQFQVPVSQLPAIRDRDLVMFPAKRLYVRAELRTQGDLRRVKRRAYTNPVWIVERKPLVGAVDTGTLTLSQ